MAADGAGEQNPRAHPWVAEAPACRVNRRGREAGSGWPLAGHGAARRAGGRAAGGGRLRALAELRRESALDKNSIDLV